MALSGAVVRELQQELGRLQQDRAKVDDHISSLQAVLTGVTGRSNGHERGAASRASLGRTRNETTLKASIVEILKTTPAGADTGHVTKVLEARGFKVGGTTSLRERTAHELRLLKIKGLIRKSRSKKYRLLSVNS